MSATRTPWFARAKAGSFKDFDLVCEAHADLKPDDAHGQGPATEVDEEGVERTIVAGKPRTVRCPFCRSVCWPWARTVMGV